MTTDIKAKLTRHNQTPRKTRLVAGLIKGKKIKDALDQLNFSDRKSALALKKLINSAVANAKENFQVDKEALYVKNLTVDKGIVMKRGMPRAFGRSSLIRKRTSNVSLVLGVTGDKDNK